MATKYAVECFNYYERQFKKDKNAYHQIKK